MNLNSVLLMSTFLLIFSCRNLQGLSANKQYVNLQAVEFSEESKKPDILLLDVRTHDEFKTGHIKGAILIPIQELESRLNEILNQKDKTILIYCRSGRRSVKASKILYRNGFRNIKNLQTGILGWKKAGLQVEEQQ